MRDIRPIPYLKTEKEKNCRCRKAERIPMLHIIINPETAAGNGKKTWNRIKPLFEKYNCTYKLHITEKPGDIERLCNALTSISTSDKPVNIVIIGGDGSMNEAVNSITDFKNTRLGLIPAGSGNDLAKDILSSYDEEMLIASISKEQTVRSVDLGLMESGENRRLFNISSGIGFDAQICEEANRSPLKSILNNFGLGKLIYILVAVKLILTNSRFYCQIKFDGDKHTYRGCLFGTCMNTSYEGGGFRFCPKAVNNDETLDFCIADGIDPLRFFLFFPSAYSGKHTRLHGIHIKQARRARVKTKTPVWLHTDGEVSFKTNDVTFSIYPEKLNLLM